MTTEAWLAFAGLLGLAVIALVRLPNPPYCWCGEKMRRTLDDSGILCWVCPWEEELDDYERSKNDPVRLES